MFHLNLFLKSTVIFMLFSEKIINIYFLFNNYKIIHHPKFWLILIDIFDSGLGMRSYNCKRTQMLHCLLAPIIFYIFIFYFKVQIDDLNHSK